MLRVVLEKIILVSAILLVIAYPSSAELSLKKKVLESCREALIDARRLSSAERVEFVPYLVRVLKMQTQQGHVVASGPDSADLPFDNSGTGNVLQSLEPFRDARAKQCAVRILRSLIPESFSALPDMVELTDDPTLPRELLDLTDSTIQFIAVRLRQAGSVGDRTEILNRLAQRLEGRTKSFAERVFIELGDPTLSFLIGQFQNGPPELNESVAKLLVQLDPHGSQVGPVLLTVAQESYRSKNYPRLALSAQLAAGLVQFDRPLLDLILLALSQDPQNCSDLAPALKMILDRAEHSKIASLDLTSESVSHFSSGLSLVEGELLELYLKLGTDLPRTARLKIEQTLLRSAKVSDKIRGLKLVTSTDGAEVFKIVSQLSQSGDLELRKQALLTAALFGQRAIPIIIKDLKGSSVELSQIAARALAQVGLNSPQAIRILIKFTVESEWSGAQTIRETVLALPHQLFKQELLNWMKAKDVSRATIAAELYLATGVRDIRALALGRNQLKVEKSCNRRLSILDAITRSSEILSTLEQSEIISCLSADSYKAVSVLKRSGVLDRSNQIKIINILQEKSLSEVEEAELLVNLSKFGLAAGDVLPILRERLSSNNKTSLATIEAAGMIAENAKDLVPALLDQLDKSQDWPEGRRAILIALAKIDRTSIEWDSFFQSELRTGRSSQVGPILLALPKELAIEVVGRLLERVTHERIAPVVRLAGLLGSDGTIYLRRIAPYLRDKDSRLRYEACMALLQIDPSFKNIEPTLARFLSSRYFENLKLEVFDQRVKSIFEKIAQSSTSFLVVNNARLLAQSNT